eukprot:g18289.t1
MSKQVGGGGLHGAMNVMSSMLLCLAFGRLIVVLFGAGIQSTTKNNSPAASHRVPAWFPTPQPQLKKDNYEHRPVASQRTAAYDAGRRGEAMPAQLEQLSNNLRGGGLENFDMHGFGNSLRPIPPVDPDRGSSSSSRSSSTGEGMVVGSGSGGFSSASYVAWAQGMRVLVFTMDSMHDTVARSKRGGPAGEIFVRESLTDALVEAGAEVDVAVSDADFEWRANTMDLYSAVIVDPWTWAGKGWRLKPQLVGRQQRIFILDFFGADKPHPNLRVPLGQHLTAFPVPASQQRTFLGYHVDPSRIELPSQGASTKRRQGVIWGKTTAYFKGGFPHDLISKLADVVELHSTVAPEDATIRHDNIVYHGHLSRDEWHQLLRESRFMIGLGDPLSGPSAVDAVVAGCTYINPIFATPVKTIYHSQHPFLAQSVGEPYACSYEQKDTKAAIACARKALEQDLLPLIPQELSKEAHATRVKAIFEPLVNGIAVQ